MFILPSVKVVCPKCEEVFFTDYEKIQVCVYCEREFKVKTFEEPYIL